MEGRGSLGGTIKPGALALLTGDVVVIFWIVVICLILILGDTKIVEAVELEVTVVGLSEISYNLMVKFFAYIVSCLGSVVNEVIIVAQVFLKIAVAKRLVAYNIASVRGVDKANTKVLTVEDQSLVSHVVGCSARYGRDMYSIGAVKWNTAPNL